MTQVEKGCVLAEELGHFHTTAGDIMDQTDFLNRKQERLARIWAYDKMIGLQGLTASFSHGCRTASEIRDLMNKKEQESLHKQENLNEFNSITQKATSENQNQTHNVRKEGIQPVNQKR